MAKSTRKSATLKKPSGQSGWANNKNLWILTMVGASLVVLVVAALLIFNDSSPSPDLEGVETFRVPSRNHQEGSVTYPQTPPVGGDHNPAWQNCGIYDQAILNENIVHSMEHGAAWIAYRPDLPAEAVTQLRELVSGRGFALLSPYPDLPAPVVASAWGVQLKVDSADDTQLAEFLTRYLQGPQTPEPGAPCTGGIGTPVGS